MTPSHFFTFRSIDLEYDEHLYFETAFANRAAYRSDVTVILVFIVLIWWSNSRIDDRAVSTLTSALV